MTRPTPSDRVAARLEHIPDGCRALLAALDRAATRGGGDVLVRLEVSPDGEVTAVELPHRYSRQALDTVDTIGSARVRPEPSR